MEFINPRSLLHKIPLGFVANPLGHKLFVSGLLFAASSLICRYQSSVFRPPTEVSCGMSNDACTSARQNAWL